MQLALRIVPLALGIAAVAPGGLTAQCGTTVSSSIGTATWTPAGSPYCVTARINVGSLTIQPGVVVRLNTGASLNVSTSLQAVGTAQQPIVFQASASNQRWRGISFSGAAATAQLAFCRFSGTGGTPALNFTDTVPSISDCSFTDNRSGCVSANLAAGDLVLSNCLFDDTGPVGGAVAATLATGNLIVQDCTFTENDGNSSGMAIEAVLAQGDLSVSDCDFSGNSSRTHGGAIYADVGGTATIARCTFTGNNADALNRTAEPAGGALFTIGDAVVTQCRFDGNWSRGRRTDNTALGRGGAIYAAIGSLTLDNTLFSGNRAEAAYQNATLAGRARAFGGAVFASFASLTATNCLFTGNFTTTSGTTDTDDRGAGIFAEALPVSLTNCTVVRGATLSNQDAGVYFAGGAHTIVNSILWFNEGAQIGGGGSVTVDYSNVEGAQPPAGIGNLNVDPMFANGTGSCDIIVAGSPCVDAGDPDPVHNDVCFPPSLGGARNDMGAHGGPQACQWAGVGGLQLAPNATQLSTPAPLTLTLTNGVPGAPAAFFIVAVNGTPFLAGLPFVITLCPDQSGSLTVNVPATTPGNSLGLQGYSLDTSGGISASNVVTVTFQ